MNYIRARVLPPQKILYKLASEHPYSLVEILDSFNEIDYHISISAKLTLTIDQRLTLVKAALLIATETGMPLLKWVKVIIQNVEDNL